MNAVRASAAVLALLAGASCAPAPSPSAAPGPVGGGRGEAPRNVILMVTDGGGVAYWTAARRARPQLAVEGMPVAGLVDTRNVDGRVTDSAAGATAYAAGARTFDGALSVGAACRDRLRRDSLAVKAAPEACEPLESLFDVARRRGKAVGVVTTTYIVDATPAAFVAKTPRRVWRDQIAEQFARRVPDVMLGGGRRYFDPAARADRRDLVAALCARSACVGTAAELAAYRADDRPLVGLFAPDDMGKAEARSPGLVAMVRAALSRLSRDPQGFVAMFESEGTDNAGHSNVPLPEITAEIADFDQAVAVALEFARQDPRTLVVVTGDHETGGFSVQEEADTTRASYTTRGHTMEMVPLFAAGPGAERFSGIRDNDEVGRTLRALVEGR